VLAEARSKLQFGRVQEEEQLHSKEAPFVMAGGIGGSKSADMDNAPNDQAFQILWKRKAPSPRRGLSTNHILCDEEGAP
jgi:hypothetical protein